ncbi:MAG: RHS repeat-associated core domain-containing protein, partial [Endozoicomonadaceae bacterium]|nr:RHS repeat-associated core domain-containing protein [Endozoicomonadaceae bacterium]
LITTANHLQQKIIFDGAGNKLSNFITAISVTGKAKTGIFLPEQRVTYDRYGRIITKSRYTFDQSVKMDMLTTKFSYDDMGRIIHTHLPDGQIIVRKYDDPDRCSVNYSEDSQGHRSVVSVTRTNILDSPKTQITLPASTVSSLPIKQICTEGEKLSSARVTRIMYDSFGRAVQVIAPNGNRIRKYYDREGRVTDFIDPAKNTTHYVYNLIGKVIATWLLPAKSNQRYLMFSAQYNAAGEPVWKAGENGKRIFYTYTSTGKISTIITPHHDIIAWKYNSVNLPVSEFVNGKEISQVQYDLVTRQPINKKDITGTTHYNYSDDERMQELIHFSKNNYPNYYLHWQYNNNRQTVNVTDIAGNSIQTQYDRFGRINTTYYQPKHKDSHLLSALSYDGLSRIMAIKYGSGMQRTLHYNGYGQQDEMTDTLAGKLLSQWQYQYDNTDNISTLRQNAGINQQAVLHYQYDNLDNLTTMTCSGSAGLPLCPRDTAFEQSSLDQAPVITRQKYYFNALNRIISVKETLKDAVLNHTLSKVTAYHYDNLKSLQRLQQINTQWNNNQLKLYNFSYDDSGNMIVDGSGNHLTYNSFNQVTKVISTQGKQSSYAYDGSGREAREITSAGDTHYLLYTGKSLFGEIVNNLHNEKKIIGYMGSANTLNGSVYRYYEKNYKGDVTGVLTKINGHYILHQRDIYSPYGMVWHSKPVADLPAYEQSLQGFNGERTDPETGWYFLGAGHRVYNPQQRYFVSADPCGDGYAFGSNNPVMNTDPSGNKPVSLKKFLNGLSYVNTLGLKAAHNKWATAAGIIVMTGLMVFSAIGISKYFGASAKLATMMSIPAFISGFFSFLSAVIPNNKGLNITSTIVGTAVAAVTLAAAGVGIFRAAVNACTVTEASGSILSDELASISDEEGETVSLIKQSDIQNIDNMQYSVLKDVASDDLSEDVVSVETDEQLNAIWQSQSKYSQQMPEYLKNDLVGLLGIARETTKKISMNDLVELIVADADRSLEAKTRYTETFNKILSSFVSNFEYIEDSDFGYDLEERMTPGMKGIAMTPKKSDNSRFVGYITREDDREDGRSIWGTYLLYKDKSIKFTVDSFEWLGLDQFFTGGYFFVKNFREL